MKDKQLEKETTVTPDRVLTRGEIEQQLQDLIKQLGEAQAKVMMLQGAIQVSQQQLTGLTNGVKNDS